MEDLRTPGMMLSRWMYRNVLGYLRTLSVYNRKETNGGTFGGECLADALKEDKKLGNFLFIY